MQQICSDAPVALAPDVSMSNELQQETEQDPDFNIVDISNNYKEVLLQ